tara:strand:+ start:164 stop:580 length:417 start_codon:yes stop_codon:yes gene_type:complete
MSTSPAQIVDESPTYVNQKQYIRIIKRRVTRQKARAKREHIIAQIKGGATYKHESRHKHACKRPRGHGGRFLTKDELDGYYRTHPEEAKERDWKFADSGGEAAPPLEMSALLGLEVEVAQPLPLLEPFVTGDGMMNLA